MLNDLQKCIAELLDCNAFELQLHTNEDHTIDCYIPYMMNDALECYFVLKNCKMTGEYVNGVIPSSDAPGDSDEFGNFACDKCLSVELIDDGLMHALVIRQTNGDVSTLWFQDIVKELNCYRYHEIGHFWVKGQEHLRQLVYMIGTIYDKYSYLGESLCNEEELALLLLMEFAPFRYWSPIHESLDAHYPDTMDGFHCFKKLCKEAGDSQLLKLTEKYEKIACGSFWITDFYRKFALPKIVNKIALELASSRNEALYELIYGKVCEASSKYPARDYGKVMNTRIVELRQEITKDLLCKGFVGKYPIFFKGHVSVLVTEEHPFTLSVLEYENYGFRMQFMVSETSGEGKYLNQGFFTGTGNHGWIAKTLDDI